MIKGIDFFYKRIRLDYRKREGRVPAHETPGTGRTYREKKAMTNELIERLHEQSYSNRLDNGKHKWADLVNLLDIAKNDDDAEYVARRLKRAGLNSEADVKREMLAAIWAQISTLSGLIDEIEKA